MRYQNTDVHIANDSGFKRGFRARVLICLLLFIAMTVIKLYPEDRFIRTKNTVKLILTKETDIRAEINKIKDIFKTEDEISAMNPVSEFINPAKGAMVVKGFGVQDADDSGFHYGVDLKLENGQNVLCAADGEIEEIATNSEYGSYIVVKHSDEIFTMYAHLNEILPNVKEKVEKGQAIARANGENDTIYFEVRRGDTYLDPAEFIDFGESQ